jgi:hypothetical protein
MALTYPQYLDAVIIFIDLLEYRCNLYKLNNSLV